MFVEGASAIHAKVLEMAPLLLCFGKFSISTQDVTKVFSRVLEFSVDQGVGDAFC